MLWADCGSFFVLFHLHCVAVDRFCDFRSLTFPLQSGEYRIASVRPRRCRRVEAESSAVAQLGDRVGQLAGPSSVRSRRVAGRWRRRQGAHS